MRLILSLGFVLFLMPLGNAQQENINSGNFMLPHCKHFLTTDTFQFYDGICAGSITTLAFLGRGLTTEHNFCFPPGVTNEQMIRVVVAYMEGQPARLSEDFRDLAIAALRKEWPCN